MSSKRNGRFSTLAEKVDVARMYKVRLGPDLATALEITRTHKNLSTREALIDAIEQWVGVSPTTAEIGGME